jgi:hypothetical protein
VLKVSFFIAILVGEFWDGAASRPMLSSESQAIAVDAIFETRKSCLTT